jgi:malonate transporter and related proteins
LYDILGAFGALWAITALGWLIGRHHLLGPGSEVVLARLVFFVAAPALLVSTVATTPVSGVFTTAVIPFVASTLIVALATAVVARWRWRLGRGEGTIATLCASYVNGGYLGIPIAAFVLGDVTFAVPVILIQVLVFTPIALAQLDSRAGLRGLLTLPLRVPIIPASLLGLAISASGWTPPAATLRPFELVGSAAVPLALLALGFSLGGARPVHRGPGAEISYAVVIAKVVIQPAIAFLIGRLLGLDGTLLLAAVVMSGLPTAQNIFVYATRFKRAASLARDAVVLSTLVGAVSLIVVALVLG